MEQKKRLFLIDGSAVFYRSHFAFIRNPLINSRGENTSAIFGFVNSLMKILSEEKPDYIGVVFDTREPTFRHKKYKPYKATREKMPDEMVDQYPKVVEFVKAFHIPVIEFPGFEADDVIATLVKRAERRKLESYMVTGDKDFMQLLSPLIKMYVIRPGKDVEIFDPSLVQERYEITPEQVIDYLALIGDKSDNVPGVTGIGEKTAKNLLKQFGTLERLYENVEQVSSQAIRNKLISGKEEAFLSRELITLESEVPIEIEFDDLEAQAADALKFKELCEDLEFRSLIERINEFTEENVQVNSSFESEKQEYQVLNSKQGLQDLIEQLSRTRFFVFDTETTGVNTFASDIIGLSFSVEPFKAWYVPLHDPKANFTLDEAFGVMKPMFENPDIKKGGQNIKYDGLMLWQHGIELRGIEFDTMVANYLVNPGVRQHNLDNLAQLHLNYKMIPIEDLIGKKGKNQKNMFDLPISEVYSYACEDADITYRVLEILKKLLIQTETYDLFRTVEMPLVHVLMQMEKNGVKIDVEFLKRMSAELEKELARLEQEIYKLCGAVFNINSPQQLGKILFEELEIHKELGQRRPKRTATGQYSTTESVLEKYAANALVGVILEYRRLIKLKSTYVDAIPLLISKRTGRVHTSFNQTVAATGRLSSSDPNLQNIPIRTEIGRKIRRAFVADNPDDFILSADYSQIELRIMAHLSGDTALQEAFRKGEDIHATTAAAIFNIPKEMVNPEHRRKAKEVNFGIIYGISQYGLASRLGIQPAEAKEIIDSYFLRFPGVNDYMIHTISFARQNKYVTTILNRRRPIPEIESRNYNIRQNAERIAINTTIQGSAADLIKIAMIRIQDQIEKKSLKSKMILQVHDELVFEVDASELDDIRKLVEEEMENAMKLDVPVKVDIGVGKNWLEAH